jgi:hypothetical protein
VFEDVKGRRGLLMVFGMTSWLIGWLIGWMYSGCVGAMCWFGIGIG